MPQLIKKPPKDCKTDPVQARRHHGTESHRQLTESARQHGILQPPGIRPTGEVVWGTGRVLAAIAAGLEEILVAVLDAPMTEAEYQVLTLTENFVRADLTPIEQVDGVEAVAKLNPDWSNKEIASRVSVDPSMVTRLRAVAACPITYAALADGRLKGVTDAYQVAKAPADQKAGLLALRVSGSTRDAMAAYGRKKRAEHSEEPPKEKSARIRIPLAINTDELKVNGTVTVASLPGEEIDLDAARDLLTEALRALNDAKKRKLTAKTFARAMKDIAASGG